MIEMDDEVTPEEVDQPIKKEPEDRGDVLPDDDIMEVDEDVVAAIAEEPKEEPKADDDRVIPKSRFDEVNNERKALKERLEQLEAQAQANTNATSEETSTAFDIDAAEDSYTDAMVEGDVDKAKSIRKEINAHLRESLKHELREESVRAITAKEIEANKSAIITDAFKAHPELDHNSDTYDKDLVARINRMTGAYMSEGKRGDEALKLAISDFVRPVAEPATAPVNTNAKQRNAQAAAAQPPNLGGIGTGERARTTAAKVESMTEAEFRALPESEKKRLRGD